MLASFLPMWPTPWPPRLYPYRWRSYKLLQNNTNLFINVSQTDLVFESRSLHQIREELSSVVANVEGVQGGAKVVLPGCQRPPFDEDHVEVPSDEELFTEQMD